MSPNDERYCSGGARGILQKRGDESPLLPQQQGLQPTVVSTGSSTRRAQLATGPVRFRVGKEQDVQEFDALREVLASANEVFYTTFNGSMPNMDDTIDICDVDPRAFENLLRFLEDKEVHFRSAATALFTLYAANKYMEPRLAIQCLQYLNNKLSSEVVPDLLVYISLFCNESKPTHGQNTITRCSNGNPHFGDHSTQTSPIVSPDLVRSDIHQQFIEDNMASCLEDAMPTLQNEANGRVGRRGSGSKLRHSPSAPTDKEIKKDIEMKDMWKKAKYLRHNCYEWVDSNADEILASESAEDFDRNVLHHIVSRPTLGVSSETRVLDLLQRWSKSECRRKGLTVTDENKMQCLGDLRFMVRYLLMDTNEFLRGYKSTKGYQGKEEKVNSPECTPPAFSGLLTNEESFWILNRITRVPPGDVVKPPPLPSSLSPWISTMECPREPPVRDFVTLDGKPNVTKDGKAKRKDGSMESSSMRSKLRTALTLGWRRSRGEKRRRGIEKEKPRDVGGRKRSKDSGTGQRCSGSCFAEYFFTALSCFFD